METYNVNIINGSLLDAPHSVCGHVANCFNTMGSGVALALRNKWPEVYNADCRTKRGDRNKLGTFSIAQIQSNPDRYVLNNYAQYCYGREKRHLDYEYLYQCLEKNLTFLREKSLTSIAYPYDMGSVNSGGHFRVVFSMIELVFHGSEIDVGIYKL